MIEIRRAKPADHDDIMRVHAAAFPSDAESRLFDMLSSDGDVTLSLVAVVEGELVGSNILSNKATTADGHPISAWAVGPIGILPKFQKQGIGSALMKAAIETAREQAVQMLFLLGDPRYYRRFGFSAKTAKPFASPYAGPYFQALMLDKSLDLPETGKADYASAFDRLGEE